MTISLPSPGMSVWLLPISVALCVPDPIRCLLEDVDTCPASFPGGTRLGCLSFNARLCLGLQLNPTWSENEKKKWMNVFSSCVETQLVNGAVNFLLGFVWKRDTRGGNLGCLQCVWTKQGPAFRLWQCKEEGDFNCLCARAGSSQGVKGYRDAGAEVKCLLWLGSTHLKVAFYLFLMVKTFFLHSQKQKNIISEKYEISFWQ